MRSTRMERLEAERYVSDVGEGARCCKHAILLSAKAGCIVPGGEGGGGMVVRLVASHLGELGSIPGFSHVGIVPEGFFGDLLFPQLLHFDAAPYSPHPHRLPSPRFEEPHKYLHSKAEVQNCSSSNRCPLTIQDLDVLDIMRDSHSLESDKRAWCKFVLGTWTQARDVTTRCGATRPRHLQRPCHVRRPVPAGPVQGLRLSAEPPEDLHVAVVLDRFASCQMVYLDGLAPELVRLRTRRGRFRIFALGDRAGRCRWSPGFLGDLPFPSALHSGVASCTPCLTLTDSLDVGVTSRPNLSTPAKRWYRLFTGLERIYAIMMEELKLIMKTEQVIAPIYVYTSHGISIVADGAWVAGRELSRGPGAVGGVRERLVNRGGKKVKRLDGPYDVTSGDRCAQVCTSGEFGHSLSVGRRREAYWKTSRRRAMVLLECGVVDRRAC
ncbi:hypothetical protein PR048_024863 [Dryococelus australis]|uniref:Uncharacterized protein n=1 Tax=Dryococelus australis TaxID=614101 RepID=A0ABQ9GPR6_9NEOP|nr:hypothetical protein PR048_024863 [Dryococelus australis]